MFWGPVVDIYSTKRTWILVTQFATFCCLSLLALSLQLPNFFFISLAALTVGAFISATYDIATDGFYMLVLNAEQMLPGAISGAIQKSVGYPLFFVLVCLFTIPGMISLLFIPLKAGANHPQV
jgi:hypothetical protein